MEIENTKIITQKPHISEDKNICFGCEKEQDMIINFFLLIFYGMRLIHLRNLKNRKLLLM